MSKIIVLMGASGSGKGTQARLLHERMRLPHISPGDLFRQIRNAGKSLGSDVEAAMDASLLISDNVVNAIVKERTARADCRYGYILDGFPRTLTQAEMLDELDHEQRNEIVAIFIDVPVEILEKRAIGRRVCPVCGEIYNIYYRPSKDGMVCDLHPETALIYRTDDYPDKVKVRLEQFKEQMLSLLHHLNLTRKIRLVNGTRQPEEIYADIAEISKGQI